MKSNILMLLFLLNSVLVYSETTPIDQVIVDDKVSLITIDFKASENKIKNAYSDKLIDGTFHYNLYVPPGYNASKDRKYFCIFIASSGGNADLGNVRNWAKNKEWIVVMLVESKNDNIPGANMSNFVSAHDDVVKRVRIQNGFKFGTGQSGGARVSTLFPNHREGFAGVILQAAGFAWNKTGYLYDSAKNNKNLTVYAIIGTKDDNFKEIAELERNLPEHTIRKLVSPDIGHQWAPEEDMLKGLEWSTDQALRRTKMTEDNKSFLISYREKQWKDANQLPLGLEKVRQLEDLSAFIKTNHITALSGEEEIGKKVSSLLLELKKDPAIIKENNAEKSYQAAQDAESNLRTRFKEKKQLAGQINAIYQQYATIAKKYPDTEYGKKAQVTADALKEEFFGDKK